MAGLKVVGLGGSLRQASRSRAALAVALQGAAAAGARVELLDLRQLGLPMYSPDLEADSPAVVRTLIDTCYGADGMLWSSPMYTARSRARSRTRSTGSTFSGPASRHISMTRSSA